MDADGGLCQFGQRNTLRTEGVGVSLVDRLDLRYRLHRRSEKLLLWFVWKLPRKVAYWAFVRVACDNGEAPDPAIIACMKRWEAKP